MCSPTKANRHELCDGRVYMKSLMSQIFDLTQFDDLIISGMILSEVGTEIGLQQNIIRQILSFLKHTIQFLY